MHFSIKYYIGLYNRPQMQNIFYVFFLQKNEFTWIIVKYMRIHGNFKGTDHGQVLQTKENSLKPNQ